jgi:hypothetical protein
MRSISRPFLWAVLLTLGLTCIGAAHAAGSGAGKSSGFFRLEIFTLFPLIGMTKAQAGIQDEVHKSFKVAPGGQLTLDSDVGNVEITTGSSDTVSVEIKRRLKVDGRQEADELLRNLTLDVSQSGNDVNVIVKLVDDNNQTNRRKIQMDFRVSMPRNFNLKLRTVGSASVGDVQGAVNASTAGGSLSIGNVEGPLTAKSGGGSLTVGNVGGDLDARSGGGSITVGRINGRVSASAGGGSVSIEEATDAIEATASGGSVKAYISRQPSAGFNIRADAGNIDLRLPDSVSISVDASCTAGRVTTEYGLTAAADNHGSSLKGDINGGGPPVVLRASAGNIRLRKAGS